MWSQAWQTCREKNREKELLLMDMNTGPCFPCLWGETGQRSDKNGQRQRGRRTGWRRKAAWGEEQPSPGSKVEETNKQREQRGKLPLIDLKLWERHESESIQNKCVQGYVRINDKLDRKELYLPGHSP